MDVRKEIDGAKGRFVVEQDGHEAELTFSVTSDALVIADHTEVPEALRGTGIGEAMVQRLVDSALSEGFKIIPLCPFVNAQRRRHPEWADAFQV